MAKSSTQQEIDDSPIDRRRGENCWVTLADGKQVGAAQFADDDPRPVGRSVDPFELTMIGWWKELFYLNVHGFFSRV